jgi:hypothetical protein
MNTIHHAITKKAAKFNVTLTDNGENFTATLDKFEITCPVAKSALDAVLLADQLDKAYPSVTVEYDAEIQSFVVWAPDPELTGELAELLVTPEMPTMIEIRGMAEELNVDLTLPIENAADVEEEEDTPSSVVPIRYRVKYREEGHPQHCGDWLANLLDGAFTLVIDGKITFDLDAFNKFLADNEVEFTGKWTKIPDTQKTGWAGRYRMNGRQKLEKILAVRGTIFIAGRFQPIPEDVLAELKAKHPVKPAKEPKAKTAKAKPAKK